MTAAERDARRLRIDAVGAFVSRFNTALLVLVCALVIGVYLWRAAKAEGERVARDAARQMIVAALADSSKAIEARERRRADSLDVARVTTQAAREIFIPARAKVVIVSDTVVRIDTALVEVPREIVRVIQASDTLIAAQGREISLLAAQVRDLAADRDVWKHRALLDEEHIKRLRPARFGFKAGAAVGAVAVVAVVSLLR